VVFVLYLKHVDLMEVRTDVIQFFDSSHFLSRVTIRYDRAYFELSVCLDAIEILHRRG
jgi:hypothetical protein